MRVSKYSVNTLGMPVDHVNKRGRPKKITEEKTEKSYQEVEAETAKRFAGYMTEFAVKGVE